MLPPLQNLSLFWDSPSFGDFMIGCCRTVKKKLSQIEKNCALKLLFVFCLPCTFYVFLRKNCLAFSNQTDQNNLNSHHYKPTNNLWEPKLFFYLVSCGTIMVAEAMP